MLNFDPTVDNRFGPPASLVDADGRRLIVSDQLAELLRRSKSDLLGMPWQSITHSDDLQNSLESRRRMAESGQPYQAVWRLMRGDGTWIKANVYASRIIDPRTGTFYFQGNFQLVDTAADSQALIADQSRFACAEYIKAVTLELAELAGRNRLQFLQHLLSMASTEAAQQLEKQLSPGGPPPGGPHLIN